MPDYRRNDDRINSVVAEARASKGDEGVAEKRLDNSQLKEELRHKLRGDKRDKDGNWVEPDNRKKIALLPEDRGIERVLNIAFEGGMNTILSQFSEDIIENDIIFFHKFFSLYLGISYEDWGVDKRDLPAICHLVVGYKKAQLYRAKGGAESEAVSEKTERIEKFGNAIKNKGRSVLPFRG